MPLTKIIQSAWTSLLRAIICQVLKNKPAQVNLPNFSDYFSQRIDYIFFFRLDLHAWLKFGLRFLQEFEGGSQGGVFLYIAYMCIPKRYGFLAVLVINGVSILTILVLNRVWFLYSSLKLGVVFRKCYFSIIIDKTMHKQKPFKIMLQATVSATMGITTVGYGIFGLVSGQGKRHKQGKGSGLQAAQPHPIILGVSLGGNVKYRECEQFLQMKQNRLIF